MTVGERSLEDLLLDASHAAPNDRIEFRDALAKQGAPAIDAMADWLTRSELGRFAIRVVGRAGQFGERDSAIRTLLGSARDGPRLDPVGDRSRTCAIGLQTPEAEEAGPTVLGEGESV